MSRDSRPKSENVRYTLSLEPLNSEFTGTKMQYSERNFKYSKSIFVYSDSINSDTLPANRRSSPSCRLDTSLLSSVHQGAEHRSVSKVMGRNLCTLFFIRIVSFLKVKKLGSEKMITFSDPNN